MHFPESKGKIRSKTAHYLIISSMWTLINSGPPPFYKSELLSMLNLYKGVISAIYTHVLMQQKKKQTVFTLKLKCTCILTNTHMLCSYTCIWIQWITCKKKNWQTFSYQQHFGFLLFGFFLIIGIYYVHVN